VTANQSKTAVENCGFVIHHLGVSYVVPEQLAATALPARGAKIVLGARGLDVITQRMRQSLLMLKDTVKR
jgi:hypothetical protein